MFRSLVALAATQEGAVAQVEEQMRALESEGYVRKGNIKITRTKTSNPGNNLWFRAEQPIVKI